MQEHDDFYDFEDDPLEGYCVRCREMVEIEDATPVWTRKGMPATRGECSLCGGTVFRMGKTALHKEDKRPAAVEVTGSTSRKQAKLPQDTVYVLYAAGDEALAQQIAADLDKAGIKPWLHEQASDNVAWAGGVHPALRDCNRMVYVLSEGALADAEVQTGWAFFKSKRKPIVIAQVAADAAPPDAIRRSPRFDFTENYTKAFRQMVQALS